MKTNRISDFYREMYDLLTKNSITNTVLNTYPDSIELEDESFVVVELPYAIKDIDISTYDVRTTFARFSFFAKDNVYKGSRMPNVIEMERMVDSFKGVFPYVTDNFSITLPRTVIPPKKASSHHHYCILNVPVVFR
ncbi:MAG: hypothetical protein ACRC9P_09850 [Bacteroides sp.]